MIIQIGTENNESRILWKHKESDEWQSAEIDDLILAYIERPQGKWVVMEYEFFTCDQCWESVLSGADYGQEARDMLKNGEYPNFCPNCGAYMRGEEAPEYCSECNAKLR